MGQGAALEERASGPLKTPPGSLVDAGGGRGMKNVEKRRRARSLRTKGGIRSGAAA